MVGKTTLAKRLVELLNGHDVCQTMGWSLWYGHMSRPPRQWDYLNGYLDHINRWTVQDRFHYGRLAYAKVDPDQEEKLTPDHIRMIEGRLALVGAVIVVVSASDQFLHRQFDAMDRHEMYDRKIIWDANAAFHSIATSNGNVDYHFHAEENFPAAVPGFVSGIVTTWIKRQHLVERLRPCYKT